MKKNNLKWHIEKRKVSDLIPADYNPRKLTDKQKEDLTRSIQEFGQVEPVIINTNNNLIGGHQRVKIYADLGIEETDVMVPDRKLTEKEEKELNIRLNKNVGEWDWKLLSNFGEGILLDLGFNQDELDIGLMGNTWRKQEIMKSLKDDYIIPPFSIFDTRLNYWRERRALWKKIIQDTGEGRNDDLLGGFKDLARKLNAKLTGTSIFDPVLTEISYRWWCPEGGGHP